MSAGEPTAPHINFVFQVISMIGYLIRRVFEKTVMRLVQGICSIGFVSNFLFKIVYRFPLFFKNPSITIQQIMDIAIASLPLIFVASFFTGAVAAESASYQFRNFIPSRYIGTAICLSVVLELGPVLTGLVLAGRTSSAIAAEIGSMKEKEELDAMEILNLDPLRYLAMPRILTCVIMFPVMSVISSFLAILGGWIDAVLLLGVTTSTYVYGLRFLFDPYYIVVSLTKALVFGTIVSLMGYYHGMRSGAGAKGVGKATMTAVVSSSVLILISDFLITYIMLSGMLE